MWLQHIPLHISTKRKAFRCWGAYIHRRLHPSYQLQNIRFIIFSGADLYDTQNALEYTQIQLCTIHRWLWVRVWKNSCYRYVILISEHSIDAALKYYLSRNFVRKIKKVKQKLYENWPPQVFKVLQRKNKFRIRINIDALIRFQGIEKTV